MRPRPRAGDRVRGAAVGLLLLGPVLLAFDAGGYFTTPRLVAALGAWALVAVAAAVAPFPWPRSAAARVAIAGLALLAVLEALSIAWAPLRGPAQDDAGRSLLYLGALLAGTALLRGRAARAAEPALLAGIVVVIAYGLSERLLPGVVELERSRSALGRLEQPLSYWNAVGALATLGLLLALRLAGDPSRGRRLRVAAVAGAPLLGAGILLTYSRGALLALAAGVLVLGALGGRAQRSALLPVLVTAALAGAGAAAADGPLLLAWLAVLTAAAVAAALRRGGVAERPPAPGVLGARAVAAVVAAVVGLIAVGGAVEGGSAPADGASAARLASTGSNRYAYWGVALEAFAAHPLRGVGSGGFAQEWLREREIPDLARDAHSLPIEVAAELGLAGLLALALFAGGVAAGARAAVFRDPAAAAGPVAVLVALGLHASLDWDWEMPALTLVPVLLAGRLLAAAEPARARTGRAPRLALAAVALVLVVPLAGGLRASVLTADGVAGSFAYAEDPRSSPQPALDVLRGARRTSLDTFPALLEAQVQLRAGRPRQAAAVLERVVAAEPANARAWARLAVATRRIAPARSAGAVRRARALMPRVGG